MKTGFSDQIRSLAKEKYIDPAVRDGRKEFSIPVRGILDSLPSSGFPRNHTPQICDSIRELRNSLHKIAFRSSRMRGRLRGKVQP